MAPGVSVLDLERIDRSPGALLNTVPSQRRIPFRAKGTGCWGEAFRHHRDFFDGGIEFRDLLVAFQKHPRHHVAARVDQDEVARRRLTPRIAVLSRCFHAIGLTHTDILPHLLLARLVRIFGWAVALGQLTSRREASGPIYEAHEIP